MSDFPHKGTVDQTRQWLDAKGFQGKFLNWEADALIGATEQDIKTIVSGERGMILWGLLNTARADRPIQGI